MPNRQICGCQNIWGIGDGWLEGWIDEWMDCEIRLDPFFFLFFLTFFWQKTEEVRQDRCSSRTAVTLLWDRCPSRPSPTHAHTRTHALYVPWALASVTTGAAGRLPSDAKQNILSRGGEERRGEGKKSEGQDAGRGGRVSHYSARYFHPPVTSRALARRKKREKKVLCADVRGVQQSAG